MKFQVIANAEPSKEFLYFEAEHEENLNDYFLWVKVKGKNNYYRRVLPDFVLEANCTLKLVTGVGNDIKKRNNKNGTDYTMFQKQPEPIWNNTVNELVCLLRKADTQFFKCQ